MNTVWDKIETTPNETFIKMFSPVELGKILGIDPRRAKGFMPTIPGFCVFGKSSWRVPAWGIKKWQEKQASAISNQTTP